MGIQKYDGSVLKSLVLTGLLALFGIASAYSQTAGRGGTDKELRDCSKSFYSTVTSSEEFSEGGETCRTYTVTVNYNGNHTYGLSHLTIGTPCGKVSSMTNSKGWPMELNLDEPTTNIFGSKVDDISNFGEGSTPQTFTVEVTMCSNDFTCMEDCNLVIAYKAGLCIHYETLNVNCISDDPSDDPSDDDDDEDDEDDQEDDEEDDEENNPTATLTSESIVTCPEDETTLNVVFTGEGPWTLTYTNGDDTQTISNITTQEYSLVVNNAGTYELEAVSDADGNTGTVSGTANVSYYTLPSVTVSGGGNYCPTETGRVYVDLTGEGPWTISYFDGKENKTVTTGDSRYVLESTVSCTYEVTNVADAHCSLVLNGNENSSIRASIYYFEEPAAVLSGGGSYCSSETGEIQVALSGEGPWKFTYSDGNENHSVETDQSNYIIKASKQGTYSIVDVADAHCNGTGSGEAKITHYAAPLAVISGGGDICSSEIGQIQVALSGEGPWSFTYSDGEENHKVETNQSTYTIQTGKAGTYTIVDLSDAHCNGSVSGAGEARIAHYEVPSAVVSGGGTICSSETGELNVNLSGVAPWTFTYSDGKESHTVTTSDANYILKTNVGGVYEVTSVSDAHCNGQGSGSAELKFVATPVVAIDGGGTICEGSKAAINFAMDGQGPWIVDFTDGKNSFSFETEEKYYTLMVSEGGTYAVTNIRNGVCSTGSFTGVVEVEKVEKLNGTVTLQDTYCEGEDIRLSLDVNGNDSEINWSVEGGSGQFSFSSGSEVTYTPSDMDEEITFTASVENQCENVSFSAVTRISKMSSGYTTFPVTEEIVTQVGYDISATNTNGETYVWTFGDGTTQEGETINHTFTESGDYNVTLEIFEGDCVTENSFLIKVASNSNLFVPSVFNPTSTNAENRVVKVYGEDISTDGFSFKVFNRWGKVVYTTQNFSDARNSGWDGTYGSEPQENGVYTYLLQGKFNSGKQFEKTGTITLVK